MRASSSCPTACAELCDLLLGPSSAAPCGSHPPALLSSPICRGARCEMPRCAPTTLRCAALWRTVRRTLPYGVRPRGMWRQSACLHPYRVRRSTARACALPMAAQSFVCRVKLSAPRTAAAAQTLFYFCHIHAGMRERPDHGGAPRRHHRPECAGDAVCAHDILCGPHCCSGGC